MNKVNNTIDNALNKYSDSLKNASVEVSKVSDKIRYERTKFYESIKKIVDDIDFNEYIKHVNRILRKVDFLEHNDFNLFMEALSSRPDRLIKLVFSKNPNICNYVDCKKVISDFFKIVNKDNIINRNLIVYSVLFSLMAVLTLILAIIYIKK